MPRPSPVTAEQEKELVSLYLSGTSRNELARLFNASRHVITDRVRRAGIPIRGIRESSQLHNGLPLNHNAFSSPESNPQAAYWIGFLMADGCVSLGSGVGSPHVILVLSVVDEIHIHRFRDFLESSHAIQRIPATHGRAYNSGECVRLDVVSTQLASDLIKHGVTPRKTHTAKVSDALAFNPHFWRGVIDGDGSIRIADHRKNIKPQPVVQLTGSFDLLTQFAAFAASVAQGRSHPCKSRGVFNIALTCRPALRMLRVLYTDGAVSLARKAEQARSILTRFPIIDGRCR